MRVPDVSVIVPVYNTMPYLTACLYSLVEQTIGHDRLEVIAVDDGSTDGSAEEVDRFANEYPDVVKAVHQPNSGGPASPCNRGLEGATGRYVFFVGADDYLGIEAMERLVDIADEWGSDVAFGRMVGTNGRSISQRLFSKTDVDLNLYNSWLPFAVSNTKLFRRSVVEEHRLRYPEDLAVGSDQPFTIQALVRAKRISVLADYTCYYAVRRDDASNISFSTTPQDRLDCIAKVMDFVAGLLEAGPRRDAILTRHFTWELSNLLAEPFLGLELREQHNLCDGLRRVCDAYLTERIRESLAASARLRLEVARRGDIAALLEVIRYRADDKMPPLIIDGTQMFVGLPGFRDPEWSVPDRVYAAHDVAVARRLVDSLKVRNLRWSGEGLVVKAQLGLSVLCGDVGLRVALLPIDRSRRAPRQGRFRRAEAPVAAEWPASIVESGSDHGLMLRAAIGSDDCLDLTGFAEDRSAWSLRLRLDIAGYTYDLPIPARGRKRSARFRRGARVYRLIARPDMADATIVRCRRVPIQQVIRAKLPVPGRSGRR